jgi:hypothetical protein
MNIVIAGKYRLTSDALNVMVHELRTIDPTKSPNWPKRQAEGADPTPRQEWSEPISFHSTVDRAITAIIDREIRLSDASTLDELIAEIHAIKTKVKEALSGD